MPTLAQTPIPSQCDRILALLKEGKSQNRKIPSWENPTLVNTDI